MTTIMLIGKIKESYLTMGLFLFNLLIGLRFINAGIFHFDSIALAEAVEIFYKKGLLFGTANGRYGAVIINSILYFPFYLAGQNADFITRFSSILFHSLSIVALFLFIKELFADRVQALLGALLFSFIPFYFVPNTYGKEHGMAMFFLLMSFYLTRRGLAIKCPRFVSLASITFLIALTIRESILVMLPLFILLFFLPKIAFNPFKISYPQAVFPIKLLVSFLLPLIAGLIFVFTWYLWPILIERLNKDNTTGFVFFLGLLSPMLPMAIKDMFISIPLFMFVLFFIGIMLMLRVGKVSETLFMILWSLLIFYFGNTNGYVARYMDIVAVPLCISASYALCRVVTKSKLIASVVFLCCILQMFLFMYPILEFRHQYNGKKQFAYYLKAITEKNAVIITAEEGLFISYYGDRKTIWLPVESRENLQYFVKEVRKTLSQGIPVYYTNGGLFKEYEELSYNFVNNFFNLSFVGEKINDDYFSPELCLNLYMQKVYKVTWKT